jgi:hypothetical protein
MPSGSDFCHGLSKPHEYGVMEGFMLTEEESVTFSGIEHANFPSIAFLSNGY